MDDFRRSSWKKVEYFIFDSDIPRKELPSKMKRLQRRKGRSFLSRADRKLTEYDFTTEDD